ncbi:hypothetical protein BOH78_4839 [Pichia kudriavzevii]|uniref:Uncharacterized protein n=1 Tax=Pichia kudriavzevii TaxID=4909 RepID=A0A1V2LGP8_PICKU|nr:hypothetical protein BOH78_4839 [Pichia kudriavzevii]
MPIRSANIAPFSFSWFSDVFLSRIIESFSSLFENRSDIKSDLDNIASPPNHLINSPHEVNQAGLSDRSESGSSYFLLLIVMFSFVILTRSIYVCIPNSVHN